MNGNKPNRRWTGWVRLPALLAFCLVAAFSLQQGEYDLLLKGGYVIDPRNGISGHRDVAISEGKIAAVSESIDESKATRTLDVSDLYITPGLVDLHVHMFSTTNIPGAWAGDNSVQPDSNTLPTGVTTAVDAGSSGWRNFEFFRHTVIDKERLKTRMLAHINIAGFGMITDITEQKDFNPEEVARLAEKHKDVIVGVKSAHYRLPDWASVDEAVKAVRWRAYRSWWTSVTSCRSGRSMNWCSSGCDLVTCRRICFAARCRGWTRTASCTTICIGRASAA